MAGYNCQIHNDKMRHYQDLTFDSALESHSGSFLETKPSFSFQGIFIISMDFQQTLNLYLEAKQAMSPPQFATKATALPLVTRPSGQSYDPPARLLQP